MSAEAPIIRKCTRYEFDPAVSEPGPGADAAATVVDVQGRRTVVCFGGWSSKKATATNSLIEMDPATRIWSNINVHTPPASSPCARSEHSFNFVPTLSGVVLFGGFDEEKCLGDTWVLSYKDAGKETPPEWVHVEPSGPCPPPRRGHLSAVLESKLYIFGGFNGDERLCDFWAFDGEKWAEVPGHGNAPSARDASSMVALTNDRRLMVFGGFTSTKQNDCYMFSLGDSTWTRTPTESTTPAPRSGHNAVFLPSLDVVWVMGGVECSAVGVPSEPLEGITAYNVVDGSWAAVPLEGDAFDGRVHSCVVGLETEKKVLLLGGFNGKAYLKSMIEVEVEKPVEVVTGKGAKK